MKVAVIPLRQVLARLENKESLVPENIMGTHIVESVAHIWANLCIVQI